MNNLYPNIPQFVTVTPIFLLMAQVFFHPDAFRGEQRIRDFDWLFPTVGMLSIFAIIHFIPALFPPSWASDLAYYFWWRHAFVFGGFVSFLVTLVILDLGMPFVTPFWRSFLVAIFANRSVKTMSKNDMRQQLAITTGKSVMNDRESRTICQAVKEVGKRFERGFDAFPTELSARMMTFRVMREEGLIGSELERMQNSVIAAIDRSGARFEIRKNKHLYLFVPRRAPKGKSITQLVAAFPEKASPAAMCFGENDSGDAIWYDPVKEDKHTLLAGTSGSGKTRFVIGLIASILYRMPQQDDIGFLMIDTKRVGLTRFNRLPHMMLPVATEYEQAREVMQFAQAEMEKRYRHMEDQFVTNFSLALGFKPILIFIDELADVVRFEELDDLARKARGAGIYMVTAIQNPERKTLNSQVNTNIVTRICLMVEKATDSSVVLDQNGAEELAQKGEFLHKRLVAGLNGIGHGFGPFVSDDEINRLIIRCGGKPVKKANAPNDDENIGIVLNMYLSEGCDISSISANKIRKRLSIGSNAASRLRNKAAKIIEQGNIDEYKSNGNGAVLEGDLV